MLKRLIILLVLLGVIAGAAVFSAPRASKWYVHNELLPKVEARTGCKVAMGSLYLGWQKVEVREVSLSCPGDAAVAPLFRAASVGANYVPAALLKGKLEVERGLVQGFKLHVHRGKGQRANLQQLMDRVRGGGKGSGGAAGGGRLSLGPVKVTSGELTVNDEKERFRLTAASLSGKVRRGGASRLSLQKVLLSAARLPHDVTFKTARVEHTPGSPSGWPTLHLEGGKLRLLPRLQLSGVKGTIVPRAAKKEGAAPSLSLDLSGSYGGAEAELWKATGWLDPARLDGKLDLTAKKFNLERVGSLLRRSPVIHPKKAEVDGKLTMTLKAGVLDLDGGFQLKGLDLFHPALARAVVPDLEGQLTVRGQAHLKEARLTLEAITVKTRGVEATLSGSLERRLGKPVLDLRLVVPPVPCQKVLASFPPTLVPEIRSFSMRGKFSADLKARIDFSNLKALSLGGKMSIYRCKVKKAPEWVSAERLQLPFIHEVEVEPGQFVNLTISPESDDYVPYDEISPMVWKALLTTEDGAFFRHRGFITSQFRVALARNLERGGFRLGASTISMQMVKNVLLGHQKTLSRKLQELFIVWYLEQNLTKERILEIYLNVIEFGPGIYGIGAAARHYFGKPAVAISPLEAAYFATLLPSPKGRYIHYCKGQLSPKWDKYTRRILRRMHKKGHITDEEYAEAKEEQVIFLRDFVAMPTEVCQDRIETLLETWREEKRDRLKKVVLRLAPHQLGLHLPPEK